MPIHVQDDAPLPFLSHLVASLEDLTSSLLTLWTFSCLQELQTFLTIYADTTVVIDQSPNGDLLRINFNISFPALSCEFASVDVNDVLGTVSFRTKLLATTLLGLQGTSHSVRLTAWLPSSSDKQKYIARGQVGLTGVAARSRHEVMNHGTACASGHGRHGST